MAWFIVVRVGRVVENERRGIFSIIEFENPVLNVRGWNDENVRVLAIE